MYCCWRKSHCITTSTMRNTLDPAHNEFTSSTASLSVPPRPNYRKGRAGFPWPPPGLLVFRGLSQAWFPVASPRPAGNRATHMSLPALPGPTDIQMEAPREREATGQMLKTSGARCTCSPALEKNTS